MLGLVHIHVHNLLVRVLSSRHTLKTERRVTKPHHALSHTHTHTHAHTHLHIDTHTHRIASLCCSTPSQRWSLFLSHDTLLMPPCTLMHTTVLPCTTQCTPQSCTPQSCTARCAPQSCTPQCCLLSWKCSWWCRQITPTHAADDLILRAALSKACTPWLDKGKHA